MQKDSIKKYACLVFIIFIFLIKTKSNAAGSLDTVLSGTDKSQFLDITWNFDPGTYARGYVTFNNGFSLGSNMTFECNGVVSGNIRLNNHVLTLYGDLYLGRGATLVGPGIINPQLHSIYLLDVASVTGTVNISSSGTIVGNGNYLVLNPGSVLNFNTGWLGGSLHNLNIRNVNHTTLITNHNGYFTNFDGVSLEITPNNYVNLNWDVNVMGHCQIMGQDARFDSSGTTYMYASSTWEILPNTTFRISPSNGGVFFIDPTAQFILNNATFELNWWPGGYFNTNGRFVVNGFSTLRSLTGTPIYFGDGASAANDPNIIIYPGSTLFIDDRTTVKYQCIK